MDETRNRRVLWKEDLQVCDKCLESSEPSRRIVGLLWDFHLFYEARSSCLIFELEKLGKQRKNRSWIDETWERGSDTVERVSIRRSLTNEVTPFSKGIAASSEQSFLTFRRFLMKIWSNVFKVPQGKNSLFNARFKKHTNLAYERGMFEWEK